MHLLQIGNIMKRFCRSGSDERHAESAHWPRGLRQPHQSCAERPLSVDPEGPPSVGCDGTPSSGSRRAKTSHTRHTNNSHQTRHRIDEVEAPARGAAGSRDPIGRCNEKGRHLPMPARRGGAALASVAGPADLMDLAHVLVLARSVTVGAPLLDRGADPVLRRRE